MAERIQPSEPNILIRRAEAADANEIVALDAAASGQAKPEYWRDLFREFSDAGAPNRVLLVAPSGARLAGFITGEIRALEFGAERCGWIFAIAVDPEFRAHKVGTGLFDEICRIFTSAGVEKIRTLVDRDADLVLAFFRSQGTIFGRYIQMEMSIV